MSRVDYLIDESEDKFTAGNLESALSTIRKAILLNPNIDEAHIDLALVCLKLERNDEAVRASKEALRINPKLKRLIKQLPDIGLMEHDKERFAKLQTT